MNVYSHVYKTTLFEKFTVLKENKNKGSVNANDPIFYLAEIK